MNSESVPCFSLWEMKKVDHSFSGSSKYETREETLNSQSFPAEFPAWRPKTEPDMRPVPPG